MKFLLFLLELLLLCYMLNALAVRKPTKDEMAEKVPTVTEGSNPVGSPAEENEPLGNPNTNQSEPEGSPNTNHSKPEGGPNTNHPEPEGSPNTNHSEPEGGPNTNHSEPEGSPNTNHSEPEGNPNTNVSESEGSPNTESEPEASLNAEPEAPSDRMLAFMSMLNGVFSTAAVENCADVTKPRDEEERSVYFKQMEVPALSPANTILYYGIRNNTIVFEQILAVTELNRLIYIHVYHNLRYPAPRKVGEEVYDLTNLTLSDLKKRCDCTRVFNQQAPNDFKGVWPVCYLTEERFPDYQSSLTCDGFRIIGRLDYQRVACCGRFPMASKLMGREETFSAPCGSGKDD